MTLKNATLLAIIGVCVQVLIALGFALEIQMYSALNIISVFAYAMLLPFFVIIYQKQKDGN